ncbi:hypothetical protein GCM10020331_003810 [Ectobacillus funiculus]
MGKLWATYMGNSMGKCILSYYLQHVEDDDIKNLLEKCITIKPRNFEKESKKFSQRKTSLSLKVLLRKT